MKKLPKIRRPKILSRGKAKQQSTQEEGRPHITNETVADHREEVLSSARKYIYPLQHSKHRIVVVTTGLLILTMVVFFTYCTLALYQFKTTSTFLYRVTQVIPFPIARTGGRFIAYENYLFEMRHYMHFYQTQQQLDFESEAGREQLAEYKSRALDKVVKDIYVKRLAKENNVTVSNQEIDDQIEIVRSQNRLGGSERVFEDVLKDFWGWSLDDFKRSLRQQLLEQKVAATLDTETRQKADVALAEIKGGADFGATAKKYSDDPATKENGTGGEFPGLIDKTNRDLSAITTKALFELQPGQVSEVLNIGFGLQIVKNIETNGERVRGAHILFSFKDVTQYVNDLKEKQPAKLYLRLPATTPKDI